MHGARRRKVRSGGSWSRFSPRPLLTHLYPGVPAARTAIRAALRCSSPPAQRRRLLPAPCAAVREHVGSPIGNKGNRFAVVVSRFNELVTRLLLAGALEAFSRHGVPEKNVEVSRH